MTFHRAMNYGAVLQTFALCRFLEENGFTTEIIDFISEGHIKEITLLSIPTNKRELKQNVLNILNLFYLKQRKKDFDSFMKRKLPLSEARNITENELAKVCLNYEAIICGSDQIWNPKLQDASEAFFLPFGNTFRKIAYSASMGNGNITGYKHTDLIHDSLLSFSHISVREKPTYDKLIEFIGAGLPVSITVDPTLLMDNRSYFALTGDIETNKTKQPYIFLYTVIGRRQTIEAAEILAKRTGLPIYTLFSNEAKRWWIENKSKLPKGNVGPERFLAMIRDASYVVTDSYHGSVFSLQFQRPFFIIKKDINGEQRCDERIEQLCKDFKIEDQYISVADIDQVSLDKAIDWQQIEKHRSLLAENSRSYLLHALSE